MTADACWIIGPVTIDLFERDRRVPGGSVSYAARVAASFGLTARILTVVGPDADLEALAGHEVRVVPGATQTFAHDFPAGRRRLRVLARPGRTLSAADIPTSWGTPETLVLAPLLPDDIDIASFLDRWPEAETALLAQGLQRDTDAEGVVHHHATPGPALLAAARANVTVFLSEEEIEAWPQGALDALARSARRVVLTRGALGARIMAGGEV
ncbi:MAG: hypothetical protein Q8M79_08960, partial [Dehalococcoidia bacterium]|nr:hypothetical protein [Dehalococcoidia bacterium]